jgi:hypothetical protein
VLCLAGAAKLRSPSAAAAAMRTLGLPGSEMSVRALAICELVLGGSCVVVRSRIAAVALAAVYAVFALVAVLLARRRASCGCFGETHTPTSAIHAIISVMFSLVALGGALAGPRGLSWVLGRPPGQAAVLVVAVVASTYAAVIAYTELPRAWSAWSAP